MPLMNANSIDALILDIDRRENRPPKLERQQIAGGEAWFESESDANALADWLRQRDEDGSARIWIEEMAQGGYTVQWDIEALR